MKTLVVHAHPLEESYSAALRDVVCDALTTRGIEHTLVRLAQGEEPELAGDALEHLIAVYPTWWGGLPAVLLDWLQRTLGPHIDGSLPTEESPFASVRRITVVCTHGSSLFMNNLQGQPGKQTWSRVIMPLCRHDADFEWVARYTLDRTEEHDRTAFLDEVRAHFTTSAAPA